MKISALLFYNLMISWKNIFCRDESIAIPILDSEMVGFGLCKITYFAHISKYYRLVIRPRTDHSSLNRFFIENCVALTVLFQELCQVTSSFSRTVSTAQFLSKNCRAEVCGASIFYDPRVPPVPEVKPVPPIPVNIFTKYFPPLSWPL